MDVIRLQLKQATMGGLYIYDFDEETKNQQISDLESQIEDLEQENQSHIDEIKHLENQLVALKEETEDES